MSKKFASATKRSTPMRPSKKLDASKVKPAVQFSDFSGDRSIVPPLNTIGRSNSVTNPGWDAKHRAILCDRPPWLGSMDRQRGKEIRRED